MTTRSLWNYYRDEMNDNANKNNANDYILNNDKTTTRCMMLQELCFDKYYMLFVEIKDLMH